MAGDKPRPYLFFSRVNLVGMLFPAKKSQRNDPSDEANPHTSKNSDHKDQKQRIRSNGLNIGSDPRNGGGDECSNVFQNGANSNGSSTFKNLPSL